jgi:hypothetical protein
MIGNLIVAAIVLGACMHFAARFLPASWRQRFVYALAQRGADQSRMAKWFNTESGCGSGCDSCKSCAPVADEAKPDAAPTGHQRVIKIHTLKRE